MFKQNIFYFSFILFIGCVQKKPGGLKRDGKSASSIAQELGPVVRGNNGNKVIHVFVALCDNKYQGIVPVPANIGNGQNATTNLYWGAAYGVKSYFSKSKEWTLLQTSFHPENAILERVLFKHKISKTIIVADAYDGQFIKQAITDFLKAAAGDDSKPIVSNNDTIFSGGASDLIAYVGHDGLMDFSIEDEFPARSHAKREAIILACYSKNYFRPYLKSTGAEPLVWSTGLMAPEAYTLHDAIGRWIAKDSSKNIQLAAAKAYSKFQKCSLKAASNLLVQGW